MRRDEKVTPAMRPFGLPVKSRKAVPYQFVLDAVGGGPDRNPLHVRLPRHLRQDKIVLMLRDKQKQTEDNGVWLATTAEDTTRA